MMAASDSFGSSQPLSHATAAAAAGSTATRSAGTSSAPPRPAPRSSAASIPDASLPLNHYMRHTRLPALRARLEHFTLYETRSKLYLVGCPASGPGSAAAGGPLYRILKIDRLNADYASLLSASSSAFQDDYLQYDAAELSELLRMIDQGNASVGGLKEVASNVCGIIGFVRFVQGWYMILGCNRKLVGKVGGHLVYEVGDTIQVPVTHHSVYTQAAAAASPVPGTRSSASALLNSMRGSTPKAAPSKPAQSSAAAAAAAAAAASAPSSAALSKIKTNESRYRNLFGGLDLSKNFYFCPTGLELTQTLQANMTAAGRHTHARAPPPKGMYMWNNFMLSKFYRLMHRQAREDTQAQGQGQADGGKQCVFGRYGSPSGDGTGRTPEEEASDDEWEETEGFEDELSPEVEAACDAALPHGHDAATFHSASSPSPSPSSSSSVSGSSASAPNSPPPRLGPMRSSPCSRRAHLNPAAAWCIPLIHGYFVQTSISVSPTPGVGAGGLGGQGAQMTLLARRSRFFAGTRYLKRGINSRGQAANDVEVEQILWTRTRGDPREGDFTSFVQVRASIPLFWSQEGNPLVAQPAIVVQKVDPLHLAGRAHFEDLASRYGSPLLVLNLVKQNEKARRESIIGEAFRDEVEFINNFIEDEDEVDGEEDGGAGGVGGGGGAAGGAGGEGRKSARKSGHQIDYLAWDFKKVSKSKTHSVVEELGVIGQWALQRVGLFHSRPHALALPTSATNSRGIKPNRESIRRVLGGGGDAGGTNTLVHGRKEEEEGGQQQSHSTHSWASHPTAVAHTKSASSSCSSSSSAAASNASSYRQRHFWHLSSELAAQGVPPSVISSLLTGGVPRPLHPPVALALSLARRFVRPDRPRHHIAFVQRGVCRTNCIDSLDRTNVAQFCIGKTALGYQLFALGLTDSVHLGAVQGSTGIGGLPDPPVHSHGHSSSSTNSAQQQQQQQQQQNLHTGGIGGAGAGLGVGGGGVSSGGTHVHSSASAVASSEIVNILLDLYEGMGDVLSQQYGGSAMHRSISANRSKDGLNTLTLTSSQTSSHQPSEVLVSIRRHIQNSFQDNGKQDAINLFLGYFVPPEPGVGGSNSSSSSSNLVGAGASSPPPSRSSPSPSPSTVLTTSRNIPSAFSSIFPFGHHPPNHHGAHARTSSFFAGGGGGDNGSSANSGSSSLLLTPGSGSGGSGGSPHIWDLSSDYYLHNVPTVINVLNKVQYNVRRRPTRRRTRQGRGGEQQQQQQQLQLQQEAKEQLDRQLALIAAAKAGTEVAEKDMGGSDTTSTALVTMQSQSLIVAPSSSSPSPSIEAEDGTTIDEASPVVIGHPLLELGHYTYPDASWWQNPIKQFERNLRGYLPEWALSFPQTTAAAAEATADSTHRGTAFIANRSLRDPRLRRSASNKKSKVAGKTKDAAAAAASSATSPPLPHRSPPHPSQTSLPLQTPTTPAVIMVPSFVSPLMMPLPAGSPRELQLMAADETPGAGVGGAGAQAMLAHYIEPSFGALSPRSRSVSPPPTFPPSAPPSPLQSELYYANVHGSSSAPAPPLSLAAAAVLASQGHGGAGGSFTVAPNGGLSSFDDMLQVDGCNKTHCIRILASAAAPGQIVSLMDGGAGLGYTHVPGIAARGSAGGGGTLGGGGVSSLIPRFLWRRFKADDEAEDDADEEVATTSTGLAASSSSPPSSKGSLPPSADLKNPAGWLDPSQRPLYAGNTGSGLHVNPQMGLSDVVHGLTHVGEGGPGSQGVHSSPNDTYATSGSTSRFDEPTPSPRAFGNITPHASSDHLSAFLPAMGSRNSSLKVHTLANNSNNDAAEGPGMGNASSTASASSSQGLGPSAAPSSTSLVTTGTTTTLSSFSPPPPPPLSTGHGILSLAGSESHFSPSGSGSPHLPPGHAETISTAALYLQYIHEPYLSHLSSAPLATKLAMVHAHAGVGGPGLPSGKLGAEAGLVGAPAPLPNSGAFQRSVEQPPSATERKLLNYLEHYAHMRVEHNLIIAPHEQQMAQLQLQQEKAAAAAAATAAASAEAKAVQADAQARKVVQDLASSVGAGVSLSPDYFVSPTAPSASGGVPGSKKLLPQRPAPLPPTDAAGPSRALPSGQTSGAPVAVNIASSPRSSVQPLSLPSPSTPRGSTVDVLSPQPSPLAPSPGTLTPEVPCTPLAAQQGHGGSRMPTTPNGGDSSGGTLPGPPPTPLNSQPVFRPATPSSSSPGAEGASAAAPLDGSSSALPPPLPAKLRATAATTPALPVKLRPAGHSPSPSVVPPSATLSHTRLTGPHGSSVTIITAPPRNTTAQAARDAAVSTTIFPSVATVRTHTSVLPTLTAPVSASPPMPTFTGADHSALRSPSPSPSPSSSHYSNIRTPLVFSHAPPTSSISLRNAKKAMFYVAYLRRAALDEPFLHSTFTMDRHPTAHDPISIELEDDKRSADMYAQYCAPEGLCD